MTNTNCIRPGFTLRVIFRDLAEECAGESGFIAECLEIPGCMSQGETFAEAEANIKDAIQGCLSVLFEDYLANATKRGRRDNSEFNGIERLLEVAPPHLLAAAEA